MTIVESMDFSKYRKALVEREHLTEQEADLAWHDLLIILTAMEQEPTKSFALTVAADRALHGLLLDTTGHFRFSAAVFGPGMIVAHDPWAWGTKEFEIAWSNTRAAFAEHGIDLPVDYRATAEDRQAEVCVVNAQRMAEVCVLGAKRIAEVCVMNVKKVTDLVAA